MNDKSSFTFWETILEQEHLGIRRFFRELPLPPETLDSFPKRYRPPRRDIHLPLHILSVRQKEVIFCLFYDCLTEDETARFLGISRRSVRTHKQRALQKLKNALGDQPP